MMSTNQETEDAADQMCASPNSTNLSSSHPGKTLQHKVSLFVVHCSDGFQFLRTHNWLGLE